MELQGRIENILYRRVYETCSNLDFIRRPPDAIDAKNWQRIKEEVMKKEKLR